MNNNPTNKNLLLKLRFPEFKDDGEWEESLFEDLAEFLKGKSISKADINNSGTLFCIRYGELYTLYNEIINSVYSKTNLNPDKLVLSQKNDVLIPSSGETKEDIATASCLMKDNIALGGDINIIRSQLNGVFLSYYLNSSRKREISKIAQGNSVVHLYSSQLKKLNIKFPNLKEQQKIADCLSCLDVIIEASNEKLNLLKTHKKGLLQQLFPAEGEKVPKLRFPEFENDGDWEEKMLLEVCDINPNCSNLPKEFVYIDLESVKSGKLVKKNIILKENAPSRAQRLLRNEDIIFQTVRPYQMNNYFFRQNDNFQYVASTGYALLRAYQSKIYLYQYTYNKNFVCQVLSKCSGSNYPAISTNDLKQISVSIPKNTKEQQKIADCLTAIDNEIEAQADKIKILKLHKKGLMQQLFPTLNEEA